MAPGPVTGAADETLIAVEADHELPEKSLFSSAQSVAEEASVIPLAVLPLPLRTLLPVTVQRTALVEQRMPADEAATTVFPTIRASVPLVVASAPWPTKIPKFEPVVSTRFPAIRAPTVPATLMAFDPADLIVFPVIFALSL
jgi:hypothetical protein